MERGDRIIIFSYIGLVGCMMTIIPFIDPMMDVNDQGTIVYLFFSLATTLIGVIGLIYIAVKNFQREDIEEETIENQNLLIRPLTTHNSNDYSNSTNYPIPSAPPLYEK